LASVSLLELRAETLANPSAERSQSLVHLLGRATVKCEKVPVIKSRSQKKV
jgi:hypothetical protein